MRTERVTVAADVELAVDRWAPDGATDSESTAATLRLPPFLLVHGLASNARLWDGVAQRVADLGHEVATVDLRGHGRSAKPDFGYEVATVADDVARFIESLSLDRPIVVGQSWGGNVVVD